jgi:histone H3
MRFLNHHYTHNSDVMTCAHLKRTPATINIPNHGLCQTTARKSTGEKPPHLHLATKAARAYAQQVIAVRKPCHFHPGTVALREIHKFKKTTNLLIRKAPFQPLVCKLALKFGKRDLQMQSTAVLALQEAVEYFMIDVISDTNLYTAHSKRVTIKVKNLVLVCHIQGIGMARA